MLFYVLFVSVVLFYVLFACKCVLYYCHRVSIRLQLNMSYIICREIAGKDLKIMIYKDDFTPVTVKFGKSDLEDVDPSSGGGGGGGGDGSEEMMVVKMMMIDDVELISGIHIASRIFVNFLLHCSVLQHLLSGLNSCTV